MTDLKNSIFGLLVESELFIEFTCAASVTHDLGFKVFFAQLQSAGNGKSHAIMAFPETYIAHVSISG